MANTKIRLKSSGVTGNVPSNLQFGELALNYADGKLFFKRANNQIASIDFGQVGTLTDSFSTINANSTLVLASSPSDTLSIVPGNNITIFANATSKTITFNATANGIDQIARDTANTALIANSRFAYSNTVNGVPNYLPLAQAEINLTSGRLYLQLNNGQIVDISSTPVGKTYYVSTNGNDEFDGTTPSSAKATIASAVAMADPGDSVVVTGGTYVENTPIIIPQNVQVQGAGERNCIIVPSNLANDIFWVNNNGYVTGFKFKDYTGSAIAFPASTIESNTAQGGGSNTITLASSASIYEKYYNSMEITITGGTGSGQSANIVYYNPETKVATVDANWSTQPNNTSTYALKIPLRTSAPSANTRYSTFISGSPYIYNSSSITTTGTGIKVDGDLATGNKSIISAQFTQVNSGGKGIHILNDGYSQLVSIYAIFCDTGFLAESGGTASMGNCNVNFGNRGLIANGKGKLAMSANIANTSLEASFTLNLTNVSPNTTFVTANTPYNGLIMKIDGDNLENYYAVTQATPSVGGNTTVTFQNSIANSIPTGTGVKFYQQSQLRASGQTFEYVGAGTSVAAIPRFGGVANSESEIIVIGEGAVFATATDQAGNFKVSDLTINQSTATISGRTFSKSLFAEMTPYILALEG